MLIIKKNIANSLLHPVSFTPQSLQQYNVNILTQQHSQNNYDIGKDYPVLLD